MSGSGNNPGNTQYWKNIIPKDKELSDREGIYYYGDDIYTDICTRTNLLEYADEDLEYLNGLNNKSTVDLLLFFSKRQKCRLIK